MWPFTKREQQVVVQNDYKSNLEQVNACKAEEKAQEFLNKLLNLKAFDPMSVSAVFCAVNLISNGLAQMPWEVRSLKAKEVPNNIYLNHLFDGTLLSKFTTMKEALKDVLIHGNGYIYIYRDSTTGQPTSLRYIPQDQVVPNYDAMQYKLRYQIPIVRGGYIEPIDVIHFKMNTKNGVEGIGILQFARKALELCGYTELATTNYYKNGMQTEGIIKGPESGPRMTDKMKQDIRTNWRKQDGEVKVLEGGLQYQQIQSSAKDAQLIQSRLFNVQEMSRYFNINPVLLNDLSKTAYNTIEQAQLEFVTHTLAPYIIMIEEELNRKIVMPNDKNKYYIDLDEEAIIKLDRKTLIELLTNAVTKGLMTQNEGRKKLGLDEVEGGDKLIVAYSDVNQNSENGQEDKNNTFKENGGDNNNDGSSSSDDGDDSPDN